MGLFQEGILLGLVLSLSIGPIFFALVQASIRQGIKAGVWVATGVWISDFLFIAITYLFISQLTQLRENEWFSIIFGLAGGTFLLIFGIILFLKKPPSLEELRQPPQRYSSTWKLWLNGFLVNTINPFTVFFWLTTMTDGVINRSFNLHYTLLFFGGIMSIVILSDFLKAYFADKIRYRLQPWHMKLFSWFSGIIVIGFSIAIAIRGFTGF